jgi:hypothetical protein
MAIHESEVLQLPQHLGNLKRLSLLGYGNSRVTSLTTVASLVTDLETFAGLISANLRPLIDAAIQTVKWMELKGLLNTTIVTALTTVYDTSVSATTDLSYNIRGISNYPATFPNTGADITYIQPLYQA